MFSVQWFNDRILLMAVLAAAIAGGAAVLLSTLVAQRGRNTNVLASESTLYKPASTRGFSPASWLVGFVFASFVALSYYRHDFTFPDSEIFFETVRGNKQYYPPPSWPSVGRFFPLAHQEFQFLSRIDASGLGYMAFSAAQLLLTCAVIKSAMHASLQQTALLYIGLLLSAPIFIVYSGLVFSERNVIFLLAFMLWCLNKYNEKQRLVFLFFGVASVVPMLLYKETAFIFPIAVGALCFLGFLLASRRGAGQTHDAKALLVVGVPLLALPVLFLAFYALFIVPRIDVAYGSGGDRTLALLSLLNQTWWWFFLAVAAARVYLLAVGKIPFTPLLDGILIGAFLYSAAIVYLGLELPYYHAPTVFVAWCCAIFLLRHFSMGSGEGRAVFLSFCAVALLQVPQAVQAFQRWKEVVHANASAARFVADLYALRGRREEGRSLALLVMNPSDTYKAGVFANFVNARYRIPLTVNFPADQNTRARSQRCINTEPVICRYGIDERETDIAVLFRSDEPAPPGFRTLFESDSIGFWRNAVSLRVLERTP